MLKNLLLLLVYFIIMHQKCLWPLFVEKAHEREERVGGKYAKWDATHICYLMITVCVFRMVELISLCFIFILCCRLHIVDI